MPRPPKLGDAQAWEQMLPFFGGSNLMDAKDLRSALEEAGREDLIARIPDLKAAGYFKGRVDVRDNRPVHVFKIGE